MPTSEHMHYNESVIPRENPFEEFINQSPIRDPYFENVAVRSEYVLTIDDLTIRRNITSLAYETTHESASVDLNLLNDINDYDSADIALNTVYFKDESRIYKFQYNRGQEESKWRVTSSEDTKREIKIVGKLPIIAIGKSSTIFHADDEGEQRSLETSPVKRITVVNGKQLGGHGIEKDSNIDVLFTAKGSPLPFIVK